MAGILTFGLTTGLSIGFAAALVSAGSPLVDVQPGEGEGEVEVTVTGSTAVHTDGGGRPAPWTEWNPDHPGGAPVGNAIVREAIPANTTLGCGAQINWSGGTVNDDCPIRGTVRAPAADDVDAAGEVIPPSTEDLLMAAVARARVPGAGPVLQPGGRAHVGIPVIAHATVTEHQLSVDLGDGLVVPLALHATAFEVDFGGGAPGSVSVSDDPGGPYPDGTHAHAYTTPARGVRVTVTTTWAVTATNPFTGARLTADGLVRTREQTASFDVVRPVTALTDDADRRAGR